jgi:hypothetical protein
MTTTLTLPSVNDLAKTACKLVQAAHEAGDKANENALNKAIFYLQIGIEIMPTFGGFLVPSGSRTGIIHRISHTHGCSCEAASKGRQCWHQSAIEIIEATRQQGNIQPDGDIPFEPTLQDRFAAFNAEVAATADWY